MKHRKRPREKFWTLYTFAIFSTNLTFCKRRWGEKVLDLLPSVQKCWTSDILGQNQWQTQEKGKIPFLIPKAENEKRLHPRQIWWHSRWCTWITPACGPVNTDTDTGTFVKIFKTTNTDHCCLSCNRSGSACVEILRKGCILLFCCLGRRKDHLRSGQTGRRKKQSFYLALSHCFLRMTWSSETCEKNIVWIPEFMQVCTDRESQI